MDSLGLFHQKENLGLPGCSEVKSPPANAGDVGSMPNLGESS